MASNREERFLMRQRGAGARELRDSGFNLAIPRGSTTPSQPTSSSKGKATPASRRKTPTTSDGRRRIATTTPSLDRVQESAVEYVEEVEAGPSTTTKDRSIPTSKSLRTPNPTTSKRKRKSIETGNQAGKRVRTSAGNNIASTIPESSTDGDDVLESPATFATSAAKKVRARSSLVSTSTPSRVDMVEEDDELASPEVATVPIPQSSKAAEASSRSRGKRKAPLQSPVKAVEMNSRRRVKQKVPLQQSSGNVAQRRRKLASKAAEEDEPSAEEKEPGDNPAHVSDLAQEARANMKAGIGSSTRRKSQNASTNATFSNRDASSQRSVTAATSSRPAQRKPKKIHAALQSSASAASAVEERSSRVPSDAIPISVYRLSNPSALTFFQPGSEMDELAVPPPTRKRAGVNSIDILSQISHELVAKTAAAFRNGGLGAGSRSEGQRKAAVVEQYGAALGERMMVMTAALDHNIGLQQHARTLAKKRSTLLSELQELQGQRRKLSLQHDRVRREHDVAAKKARRDHDLSQMLEDIELAAQRGRAAQARLVADGEVEGEGEIGLELRIRDVVERVSSYGGRIGLLERLQRFNAYLEAVAALPDDAVAAAPAAAR